MKGKVTSTRHQTGKAAVKRLPVKEVRGGLTINLPDGGMLMLSVNPNHRANNQPYHICTYIKVK